MISLFKGRVLAEKELIITISSSNWFTHGIQLYLNKVVHYIHTQSNKY